MKRLFSLKATPVAAALLVVAVATGCTMKSQQAPALTGPSEFGTGITVTATPDAITQDGASQSLITVSAFDSNGKPLRNLSLRSEIFFGGTRTDFGTLSARNLVTDSNGRATLVYTAPASPAGPAVDQGLTVQIAVTPLGTNFDNETPRLTTIRLVPPGVVVPPDGLQPKFTFTPPVPTDHQDVFFDASTSVAPANNPIVTYSWDFGDGQTGSGKTATHAFNSPGTYFVRLTVSDTFNRTASTSQSIAVIAGTGPTASFLVSPTPAAVGQVVNFNASASRPAAGRTIRTYAWDFGDGDQKVTTGPTTTHDFVAAGIYAVTLVVTDDAGRSTASTPVSVTVGASQSPVASFVYSPQSPVTAPVDVTFDASASRPAQNVTITRYQWLFGEPGSVVFTSTSPTITHTYTVPGNYTITLTVFDNQEHSASTTRPITVR